MSLRELLARLDILLANAGTGSAAERLNGQRGD